MLCRPQICINMTRGKDVSDLGVGFGAGREEFQSQRSMLNWLCFNRNLDLWAHQ